MWMQVMHTKYLNSTVSNLLHSSSFVVISKSRSNTKPENICCKLMLTVVVQMHIMQETAVPEEYGIPANTLDPSISWKDVYWLQSITRLPIIIKGILTKEDAELAVEHGVQGIIVSNHGGRQLDGGPASVLTDRCL